MRPLRHAKPQTDALQVAALFAGAVQTVLQAPQFVGSLRVSTHAPLQAVEPEAQLSAHLPWEQVSILPHLVPHAPQFATSAARFTHAPAQAVYPASHVIPHWPLAQTAAPWRGAAHLVSQAPQCAGSLSSRRHWPEHAE